MNKQQYDQLIEENDKELVTERKNLLAARCDIEKLRSERKLNDILDRRLDFKKKYEKMFNK